MAIWGSTVVAVEIPLPEHCCSNGSKPRWVWGPFWLFLAVENPAGPKKDFSYKKMGIWGSTVVPPYALFLQKNIFSTRLAFCMLRTAKKAAKGTRACLRSSSSALATVIQLSTPRRGRFWRCLVSLCAGAVRCTQPTDPPQIVFYAQGYCPGLSDHRRSDSPYSAALTQH